MKYLIIISFIFASFFGYSQKVTPYNLPTYDLKRLHFGFIIGFPNSYNFKINYADNFNSLDSVYILNAEPKMGFTLGIISNLNLHDNVDLRLIPELAFTERKLNYTFIEQDTIISVVEKSVESSFINLPLLLKYKSDRYNNFRTYLLAGGKVSLDLASQKNLKFDSEDIRLRLNRFDAAYEIGVGFDFYLEYFKFSTELKYSFGFVDILKRDNTEFTTSIDKLTTQAFVINFCFE